MDPTLLTWDPEEEGLRGEDRRQLAKILHRADLNGVIEGLGHGEAFRILNTNPSADRVRGRLRLIRRCQEVGIGFAALVSPTGVRALRSVADADMVIRVREGHEKNSDCNIVK